MENKDLLDIIHRHLFSRKLDIHTGKPVIDVDLEQEFFKIISQNNNRILSKIKSSNGQYFHVLNHVQGDLSTLTHNVKIVSNLLPKKLIITSFVKQGSFKHLLSGIYERFKVYLENGLIELYIDTEEHEMYWKPDLNNKKALPQTMQTENIQLLTQSYDKLNYDNTLKFALPWLENARPEDYIEIINKNKLQYAMYCNHIDKLCAAAQDPNSLTSSLIKEANDAFLEIQIALEKSKAELIKKGIRTSIGIVATAIPFVIPPTEIISAETLATFLGATNLISTVPSLIDNCFDYTRIAKTDNPYWLLWKWNQITIN